MRLILALLLGLSLRAEAAHVYGDSGILYYGLANVTASALTNLDQPGVNEPTMTGTVPSAAAGCPVNGAGNYVSFTGSNYLTFPASLMAALTASATCAVGFTTRRNTKANNSFVFVDNNGGGLKWGVQMGTGASGVLTYKRNGSDAATFDFGDDAGVERWIVIRANASGVTMYASTNCGTLAYVTGTANNGSPLNLALTAILVGSFQAIGSIYNGIIGNVMISTDENSVYPPVLPTPTPTPVVSGQRSEHWENRQRNYGGPRLPGLVR